MTDPESGRSRRVGVVDMSDGKAVKAIAALNGKDVEGRMLTVSEARLKTHRPSGGGPWRKRW